MPQRSHEIYRPQRLADIIALAPLLGFGALQAWFDSQPPTPGASPRTKLILGAGGVDPEYSATIRHARTARVRTTSVAFTPIDQPYTRVNLRGRKQAPDTPLLTPQFADYDWADHQRLRWRRDDGVLDLVSLRTWVGEGFELPIITVATPNRASVVKAEEILFNAARLLTDPHSQAPATVA